MFNMQQWQDWQKQPQQPQPQPHPSSIQKSERAGASPQPVFPTQSREQSNPYTNAANQFAQTNTTHRALFGAPSSGNAVPSNIGPPPPLFGSRHPSTQTSKATSVSGSLFQGHARENDQEKPASKPPSYAAPLPQTSKYVEHRVESEKQSTDISVAPVPKPNEAQLAPTHANIDRKTSSSNFGRNDSTDSLDGLFRTPVPASTIATPPMSTPASTNTPMHATTGVFKAQPQEGPTFSTPSAVFDTQKQARKEGQRGFTNTLQTQYTSGQQYFTPGLPATAHKPQSQYFTPGQLLAPSYPPTREHSHTEGNRHPESTTVEKHTSASLFESSTTYVSPPSHDVQQENRAQIQNSPFQQTNSTSSVGSLHNEINYATLPRPPSLTTTNTNNTYTHAPGIGGASGVHTDVAFRGSFDFSQMDNTNGNYNTNKEPKYTYPPPLPNASTNINSAYSHTSSIQETSGVNTGGVSGMNQGAVFRNSFDSSQPDKKNENNKTSDEPIHTNFPPQAQDTTTDTNNSSHAPSIGGLGGVNTGVVFRGSFDFSQLDDNNENNITSDAPKQPSHARAMLASTNSSIPENFGESSVPSVMQQAPILTSTSPVTQSNPPIHVLSSSSTSTHISGPAPTATSTKVSAISTSLSVNDGASQGMHASETLGSVNETADMPIDESSQFTQLKENVQKIREEQEFAPSTIHESPAQPNFHNLAMYPNSTHQATYTPSFPATAIYSNVNVDISHTISDGSVGESSVSVSRESFDYNQLIGHACEPSVTSTQTPVPNQTTSYEQSSLAAQVYESVPVSASSHTQLHTPAQSRESLNIEVCGTGSISQPEDMDRSKLMHNEPSVHWFYKHLETKVWTAFSLMDAAALEDAHIKFDQSQKDEVIVPVISGRYDVFVSRRKMQAAFWMEDSMDVARCSWMKKHISGAMKPYPEETGNLLEDEYAEAYRTDTWNRRVTTPNGDLVVLFSPTVAVHYNKSDTDYIETSDQKLDKDESTEPFMAVRGFETLIFEEGEGAPEHLFLVIHGIGNKCDMKMHDLVQATRDLRAGAKTLRKNSLEDPTSGDPRPCVDFLPIMWHSSLLSKTGVDVKIDALTLDSIKMLRQFVNGTVLDMLYFTSPRYCQTMVDTVTREINRVYHLFKRRNPTFKGKVSLVGHSLGSIIAFDILSHQQVPGQENLCTTDANAEINPSRSPVHARDDSTEAITNRERSLNRGREKLKRIRERQGLPPSPVLSTIRQPSVKAILSGNVAAPASNDGRYTGGIGHPQVTYHALDFHPAAFFALGSPIGMFLTVRGVDTLGEDFKLPTCDSFYNIFHPFDPVAFRVEPLLDEHMTFVKPCEIQSHTGRRQIHLELKNLGTNILSKVKSSWTSWGKWGATGEGPEPISRPTKEPGADLAGNGVSTVNGREDVDEEKDPYLTGWTAAKPSKVNAGRRVDYVLQQGLLESVNEYLFAINSHLVYWKSLDTVALLLKEME
eukprot:CFRG1729T1